MSEITEEIGLSPDLTYSKSLSPAGGKIVPRLRFPEFRRTTGWKAGVISDISTVVRGGSPRPIDDFITKDAGGLNWLRIGDVDQGAKHIYMTSQRVLMSALSKTRTISPGDLILSNSMSFGRPYISQIHSCIHDGWLAVTKLQTSVLNDFAYYLLLSEQSQTYFESAAAGSGVRNLNLERVAALPISWPGVEEQRKIVECLESLDELIAAEAEKLHALKQHKKGLLQQLFPVDGEATPRLRFPQFRSAGDWTASALEEVCETSSGGTPLRSQKDYWNGDIPWITTSLIDGNRIVNAEEFITELALSETSVKVFPTETILIAMYGQGKTRGKVAFLGIPATTNQACAAILPNESVSSNFLFFQLFNGYERLRSLSNSGGQDNLSQALIARFEVALPPHKEEQLMIASVLDHAAVMSSHQEIVLARLRTHKTALMQQLFPSINQVDL